MKPLTPEEIVHYRKSITTEAEACQFVGWMLGRAASSGVIAEEIRKLMGNGKAMPREVAAVNNGEEDRNPFDT